MGVRERELVRRCLDGEEQAWQEFHARYRPVVERLAAAALKRGRSGQDLVEEIASSVFEALVDGRYKALRSFRWQCSIETWLRILVRTFMIRRLRRKTPRPQPKESTQPEEEPPEVAMAAEARGEVRRAIRELPDRERGVLTAFFVEDASYAEISRRFGLPMGTVATVIARTRARLREALAARGIEQKR
jgi:RNA polymerase sigma-70 factor (ECF subfamily)